MDWLYLIVGMVWAVAAVIFTSAGVRQSNGALVGAAVACSLVSLVNLLASVLYHVHR